MLGYECIEGKLNIIPEEAEIVRQIFMDYLSGMGLLGIVKKLRESGVFLTKNSLAGLLRKNSSHLRKHFHTPYQPSTAPTNLQYIFTSCCRNPCE